MGDRALPVTRATARARLAMLALVAQLAFVALLAPAAAPAAPSQPPRLDAEAWILVDAADGERLAARAPSARMSIASTTKLMTAYLALRDLRPGEAIVAPPYSAAPGESLLGLDGGERIAVRDLLYGLLLASGNDAASALAVGAAGSVPAFVRKMNRAATRLGLEDTSYANPIGLDDADNYSTAADLASLAIELRRDPLFRRIVDTPRKRLASGARRRRVVNRNDLVRRVPYVNGVKTGYTARAGYVLVGSATRKGVTLISAVLGASSEAVRDAATLDLLEYGFDLYSRRTVVASGERLAATAVRHRDVSVPLLAGESVRLTVRRGQDVAVRVVGAPAEADGPIREGERLGRAIVDVDGERAGTVPVIAARAAAAATAIERIDAALPGRRAAAYGLLGLAGLAALAGVAGAVALVRRRSRSARGIVGRRGNRHRESE